MTNITFLPHENKNISEADMAHSLGKIKLNQLNQPNNNNTDDTFTKFMS